MVVYGLLWIPSMATKTAILAFVDGRDARSKPTVGTLRLALRGPSLGHIQAGRAMSGLPPHAFFKERGDEPSVGTLGKDRRLGDAVPSAERARVLVVEDDVDEANAARCTVEETGLPTEVEATPSGDRALHLLEDRRFDCVLLAFDLGDLDGLEVLRRLRERDEETSVIVWTNRDAPALEDRLLEAGADVYVAKNGHGDERIKRALDRHLGE